MYSTADPLGTGNSPAVDVSYGWKGLLVMIIRKYMVPTNHMVHGAGILTMQHSSTSKMCRHVGKYTVHWAYGVYLHSYTMLYLAFTWKDIQMIFNLTISGWKIAAEVFKYIPKCRCINMGMTWVSSWKMVPVMLIDKVTQLFIHIWYLCHLIILDPRWHTDFKHKQQATWTNWPPKAVSAGDMVGPKGSPLSREAAGRWAKSGSMAGNRAPEGCRKGARTRLAMFHCFEQLTSRLLLRTLNAPIFRNPNRTWTASIDQICRIGFYQLPIYRFWDFGQFPLILGSPKKQVRHTAPPRAPESPGISGEPLVIKHCTGKYPTHGGVHGK